MATASASERALDQRRTTLVSIAAAGVLVALKLGVGLATGSLGLISAGIESSGDVIAAVLTFFVVRLSGRPADLGHPYGHRRAENLGALGEAAILLAGGVVVAVEAIVHLASGQGPPEIHWYQFAVIAVALVIDLSRTSVSPRAGRPAPRGGRAPPPPPRGPPGLPCDAGPRDWGARGAPPPPAPPPRVGGRAAISETL